MEAANTWEEPREGSLHLDSIQIEEIMEQGLPSPSRVCTHYYVSMDDDVILSSNECIMVDPSTSRPISQFLRFPQIHISLSSRKRSEPLVDYRHS